LYGSDGSFEDEAFGVFELLKLLKKLSRVYERSKLLKKLLRFKSL
jgi:hypothetical protein